MSPRQSRAVARGTPRRGGLRQTVVALDEDTFAELRDRALAEDTSFVEQLRLMIEWGLEDARGRRAWRPTHRHKPSGEPYRLLGEGRVRTRGWIGNNDRVAVYQGKDRRLFAQTPLGFEQDMVKEETKRP